MSKEPYNNFRWRFIAAVISPLIIMWGLFWLHTTHEHNSDISLAIILTFTALALTVAFLFLRQINKIYTSNVKLLEQQEELKLKSELLDAASDAVLLI
ncbi:MAG: hypothetical protein PHU01_14210, partial [Desulfuromonadaceae bacterium]|nr:hypothetical protein [Desulfuromonadaceae bacterium]